MTAHAQVLQLADLSNYVEDVVVWVNDRDPVLGMNCFPWVDTGGLLLEKAGACT